MKRFFKFLLIGLLASGPIEFLGMAAAGSKMVALIPVVLIVYPAFLIPTYFTSKFIDRRLSGNRADVTYFFVYGFVWLMVEWFLIQKTAPWASGVPIDLGIIILGIIFQVGMFIYGATVAFMPRVFTSTSPTLAKLRPLFTRFYLPFFIGSFGIILLFPQEAKFPVAIILIIVAHLILGFFYTRHFLRERGDAYTYSINRGSFIFWRYGKIWSMNADKVFFIIVGILCILGALYVVHVNGWLTETRRESVFENGRFYENKKYGFEFQYPRDWDIIEATQRGKEGALSFSLLRGNELFRASAVKGKQHATVRVYPADGLALGVWREAAFKSSDTKKAECLREKRESICLSERDFIRGAVPTTFQGHEAYRIETVNLDKDIVECMQVKKGDYIYDTCPSGDEIARSIIATFTLSEQDP